MGKKKAPICECGFCRDGSDDDHPSQCDQVGLRNHLVFPPRSLVMDEDTQSSFTFIGVDADGDPIPRRHWAFIGEITFASIPLVPVKGMRQEMTLRSRFPEKQQLKVEFCLCSGEFSEVFQWHDFKSGNTVVILYPETTRTRDEKDIVVIHETGWCTVILTQLESIIEYSDLILGNKQKCFYCKKEAKGECVLLKCSKCKTALYCSQGCQKPDWNEHKPLCKNTMLIKQLIALTKAPCSRRGHFVKTPDGIWLCLDKDLDVHPGYAAYKKTPKELPWEDEVD